MGRTPGTSNKSNYHYMVEEYEDWTKQKLISKSYFKTQADIGEHYGMNRSAIYHTYKGNSRRVKKYNFLNIEKLNPPLPIHEKIIIDYKSLHKEKKNEQYESDSSYDDSEYSDVSSSSSDE